VLVAGAPPWSSDILTQGVIDSEYEWCIVGFPPPLGDNPSNPNKWSHEYMQRGDGVLMAGRWVVDCGHEPYKTEIHPPALLLDWHTEEFSGPGQLATLVDMTRLDWWWPQQTVLVDLYPPPRPTADSVLTTIEAQWDSGVTSTWNPVNSPNHIQLVIKGRADIPANHYPPVILSNGQVLYGCWEPLLSGAVLNPGACDNTRRSQYGVYVLRWR
jgi:hypothetical protein